MKTIKKEEVIDRITDYLSSGGLFNPEMALHDRVRDLLIDAREVLMESNRTSRDKVDPRFFGGF